MVFYYFRGISFFNYRFYWFYGFNRKKINKLPKEEIPILKETAFENIEEWYDNNNKCTMIKDKYTFDGLNGVGYYQEQLQEKKVVITIFRSLKNASKPKKNPLT
ncbi:hypothetical protein ['Chrysanthemum coronarium' phytoplasma]|uniref:Uncharacterized conserved protein n=1 Tax='Chrysanthemum coronarium' phytoplasma TaxID=1520703 RepID=A0ABQ0J498_9MOLU|nr:hypothetical protein ['Chrysanthemum coronarium' phytoplasma]GAK74384.1 uncharacterized conserved protein ['Chrysanthemum coronarium' phytoplasma]